MPESIPAPTPKPAPSQVPTVYEAVVEQILEHTVDTRSLFLRLLNQQTLIFKPGQFLSFALPINTQVITRPYSIASDPADGNILEICFNLLPAGLGSRYLFERRVGDTLRFTGPWGTFVFDPASQVENVFIADGPGIVAIRPMIRQALMAESGSAVRLLYGARRKHELLYYSEWKSWVQRSARFSFMPLLSEPSPAWRGPRGFLIEQVQRSYIQADNDRSRCFYLCGVGTPITDLRDLLRKAGYQRRDVHYEKW